MANEPGLVVDARGLACPQPLIKRALAAADSFQVTAVVDDDQVRDNIVKLADDLACSVDVNRQGADYYIRITKPEQMAASLEERAEVLYLIGSDSLGRGSEELGRLLMKNFFCALSKDGGAGKVLIFLNGGVSLPCAGSPVIDYLYQLEQDGARVLTCGTCLEFYKLREQLAVGTVTNMYTILEYLQKTPRVINL